MTDFINDVDARQGTSSEEVNYPRILHILNDNKLYDHDSLALVIVSLININNWPYIGINNFQLMNQIRTLA